MLWMILTGWFLTALCVLWAEGASSAGGGAATAFPARREREGGAPLVDAAAVAQRLGWELKVVEPGRLLTLCRQEVCVPVRLEALAHARFDEALYLDAHALARALGRTAEASGERVVFKPAGGSAAHPELPSYNAAWGEGRGFQPGQTVPDVPLFDLEGKEVRFSRFLGRPYIVYVWASW